MTTSILARALCAATFAAACAAPVHADSFASSASSAGSASSASISDSISSSSNSSSGDDRMAAGQYRVIDIAQAPAKPNTTRMTLRAVAGGPGQHYHLDVPNRALAQRGVAVGELVQVNERVYGYEFAYADTRRPFFLALQDDWQNDLGSRKVTI
jgi:type IV secretory pathway TrbL component